MNAALNPRQVAAAMGGHVHGNKALVPGPRHSPHDRSLQVTIDPAAPDGFLCHSFAGDDDIECKDYVRQRIGLPQWEPTKRNGNLSPARGSKPAETSRRKERPAAGGLLARPSVVAEYVYLNERGEPHLKVSRTEPKGFFQHHWTGSAWAPGVKGVEIVPYRLPELIPADFAFVVEGEKDADRLASLGFVATCNPMGAGKWWPSMNRWFAGKRVCIIPDDDEVGHTHADGVARNLTGVAAEVRVLALPKKDVSDWLDADPDGALVLQDMADMAPLWTPSPGPSTSETLSPKFRTYGLQEFSGLKFPEREYVLAPILPVKGTAMIFAARGVGKTHVALGASYAAASGTPFLRWRAPKPRRVFYIDGEMPGQALQERLGAIIAGGSAIPPDPDHYLRILPMDAQDLGASINLALAEHQDAVEKMLDGFELLVLDNLSTLVNGGKENDAESWNSMQGWLLRLRRKGLSVLLVHHAGRGENARGTSKREDILDTVIQLKRPTDYLIEQGARFEVHLTKCRGVHGEDAVPFEARMDTRDSGTVWTTRALVDVEADQVAELTKEGVSVRDIAEETGLSKSKVNRLQNRLRAEGRIP